MTHLFRVPSNPHTLDHELKFLATLGEHAGENRKKCIRGYAIGIEKRVRGFNGRDLLTDFERNTLRQRAHIMLDIA